jgi:hypothetical protein
MNVTFYARIMVAFHPHGIITDLDRIIDIKCHNQLDTNATITDDAIATHMLTGTNVSTTTSSVITVHDTDDDLINEVSDMWAISTFECKYQVSANVWECVKAQCGLSGGGEYKYCTIAHSGDR